CRHHGVRVNSEVPPEVKDIAWVNRSCIWTIYGRISSRDWVCLAGNGIRLWWQLPTNPGITVLPARKQVQFAEWLIVEAGQQILRGISARKGMWTWIRLPGEVHRTADFVQTGNV